MTKIDDVDEPMLRQCADKFFAQAWGELADRGPVEAEKPRLSAQATKEEREGKLADLRAAYSRQEALLGLARGKADQRTEDAVSRRMRALKGGGQ